MTFLSYKIIQKNIPHKELITKSDFIFKFIHRFYNIQKPNEMEIRIWNLLGFKTIIFNQHCAIRICDYFNIL